MEWKDSGSECVGVLQTLTASRRGDTSMKRLKRCLASVLVMCMTTYGLPALAAVAPDALKAKLTDEAMAGAVGGTYESRILNALRGSGDVEVQAMFLNMGATNGATGSFDIGSFSQTDYFLEVLNSSGGVVQTIATGRVYRAAAGGEPNPPPGSWVGLAPPKGIVSAVNNQVLNKLRARMEIPGVPWASSSAVSVRIE